MIYFIEDDRSINEAVFYSLKNSGFEVKGFEKPSEFWKAMKEETPDLIRLSDSVKVTKEELIDGTWSPKLGDIQTSKSFPSSYRRTNSSSASLWSVVITVLLID